MSLPVETLIRLQVTLEYALDPGGRLVPFPGSEEQAKVILYRHAQGGIIFQRGDLPATLAVQLAALSPDKAFTHPEMVLAVLRETYPQAAWDHYRSYIFPGAPSSQVFPDATHQGNDFVIRQDGKRLAWAWSVRENERCAEAAVETLPEFRRRGYGRQVTAAWACSIVASGRVAFFSHKVSNLASAALARSLGLEHFADCLAFE